MLGSIQKAAAEIENEDEFKNVLCEDIKNPIDFLQK